MKINRLDQQGEIEHFSPEPRKWGQRLKHETGHVAPLVEHKGKHYLELKVERSLGHEYRLNGETLDSQDVSEFLPKRKERSKAEGRQSSCTAGLQYRKHPSDYDRRSDLRSGMKLVGEARLGSYPSLVFSFVYLDLYPTCSIRN